MLMLGNGQVGFALTQHKTVNIMELEHSKQHLINSTHA